MEDDSRTFGERWWGRGPSTRATQITALVAIFALALNAWVIKQNSRIIESSKVAAVATQKSVETAERALQLSLTPEIDVEFVNNLQEVKLTNWSIYPLNRIEIHTAYYKITPNPPIIHERITNGKKFEIEQDINPKEDFIVSGRELYFPETAKRLERVDGFPLEALVIVFRRKVDGKRFIKTVPFKGDYATFDGQTNLYPIYESGGATVGNQSFVPLLPVISAMESTLFNLPQN